MNPFLVKLGIGMVVLLVTSIVAYRSSRSQRVLHQPTRSRSSFDGSFITICCICLGQLADSSESGLVSLPCKHKFHRPCIRTLLSERGRNCPVCREIIVPTFVDTVLGSSD